MVGRLHGLILTGRVDALPFLPYIGSVNRHHTDEHLHPLQQHRDPRDHVGRSQDRDRTPDPLRWYDQSRRGLVVGSMSR